MTAHINPQLRQIYEKNNHFFTIVSIVLFLIIGYFSYMNFSKLSEVKANLASLSGIEKKTSGTLSKSDVDFGAKKEVFTEREKEYVTELGKVFPQTPELTNFTRTIDDYFYRNNFASNEIFLKNMSFGEPMAGEGFQSTAVSMSITSSKNNFINFLNYVENSGALKSNVRVMDIDSIDVTFREDAQGPELYDYRISLNIYSQYSETIAEAAPSA